MGKNSVLNIGDSYTLTITLKTEAGDPINWDDVNKCVISAYSDKTNTLLKSFEKDDLVITDPSSGSANAEFSGTETSTAKEDLYKVECKIITDEGEKTYPFYWGVFRKLKSSQFHGT